MEIVTGWSTFANRGYKITPYLIDKIESRNGDTLFTANPPRVPGDVVNSVAATYGLAALGNGGITIEPTPGAAPTTNAAPTEPQTPAMAERIVDCRTTYILNSILEDVIKKGTGRRALALGRADIAGKTSTTNESKDAWFSGYNADYVTTVWTGYGQPESLGRREFGGTVSLPIWMSYMGAALKDKPLHTQPEPEGILSRPGQWPCGIAKHAECVLRTVQERRPPSVNELGNGVIP